MRTSEKQRLNHRQLAERLNCTPAAVRSWTLQGCPQQHIGRLVRFYEDDVVQWLADREARRRAQLSSRPERS